MGFHSPCAPDGHKTPGAWVYAMPDVATGTRAARERAGVDGASRNHARFARTGVDLRVRRPPIRSRTRRLRRTRAPCLVARAFAVLAARRPLDIDPAAMSRARRPLAIDPALPTARVARPSAARSTRRAAAACGRRRQTAEVVLGVFHAPSPHAAPWTIRRRRRGVAGEGAPQRRRAAEETRSACGA